MKVVYSDPAWSPAAEFDPGDFAIESEVFGAEIELTAIPKSSRADEHQVAASLVGADALVIYRTQLTEPMVDALRPTCKVVARQGVGLDNLNIPLLDTTEIFGFHVPDYCVDEVAAHTLALALALERGICVQNSAIKSDNWGIYAGGRPRRIGDLTAGIVGFGRIGRAVARRLQTFFGQVVAFDPYVSADLMNGYGVSASESLDQLAARADIVFLHCPLTEETRLMVGSDFLSKVKSSTVVINTARGGLVDPKALLDALEADRLAGYAADVFTPEDPNRDPVTRALVASDRVLCSSHRAFLSVQSEESLRSRVAEEILHVLTTGSPPRVGRVS